MATITIEVNDERAYAFVGYWERYHGVDVDVDERGRVIVESINVDQLGGWTAPTNAEHVLIAALAEEEIERDIDEHIEHAIDDERELYYEQKWESQRDARYEEGF